MKVKSSVVGTSVVAMLVTFCAPAMAEDVRGNVRIAQAVSGAITLVDGELRVDDPNVLQQTELTRALAALPENSGSVAKASRGVRCHYNCPPPVGSVTASPQVVSVPAGGMGSVTIHWRWDQSPSRPVTQYSCLWVSGGEETEAHVVQCERPGHTYTTKLNWVGVGNYTFRVAPGNTNGPFTKPITGIFPLAQTTVVGVAQ